MTVERRQQPRTPALKYARIVFNGRRSVLDCTVRNMSPKGALLLAPNLLSIPNEFELWLGDAKYKARVVWKDEGKIGVVWRLLSEGRPEQDKRKAH